MTGKVYPKMDRIKRAKQFMPFDALKGLKEALLEKERTIVPKKELSEEQETEINYRLCHIHKMDTATAEYFSNGEYLRITGIVSKVYKTSQILEISGISIPFCDISGLW